MRLKLILLTIFLLGLINLNALETTCQKLNWNDPNSVEDIALDGGICNSQFSVKQMIDNGWRVLDIQVESSNNGLNYTYIFTDEKQDESKYVNLNETISNKKLDTAFVKIYEVQDDIAKISIPNLKIGQSGIVEHIYPNQRTVIVANGYVIESNDKYSIIKLEKFDDLKQNAIPKTKRTAQDGDVFIINYLYHSSLLIAPNSQSFAIVTERFKNFRFLHSDIFATHLKLENEPLPSKDVFIEFAKQQNIGTIFFIIGQKVHILDSKTFNILYSYDILYQSKDAQLPFYTRVSEIEKAFWDIDFSKYLNFFKSLIGAEDKTEEEFLLDEETKDVNQRTKELSYDAYYKNLLGIKNAR